MKPKVLLIGWDAADWNIIWPLLAKGEMPTLKSLMDKGVYGNMATMNPPYSPMLWSTVATGKTPDKHGVIGFVELKPGMKGIRPVTAKSRKAKALWNIFHHEGLKSNLVGWWPSFPAEPINGVIVSDKFQQSNKETVAKKQLKKGVVHPESMVKELSELVMFRDEITEAHILPFIPKAAQIDQEKDGKLKAFAKMMSENVSVHSASTYLMCNTEWDFMSVYYDLIDHFCHTFMKFHPPQQNAVPDSQFEIYKDVIVGAYKFQDMMLGRTLQLVDEDTTVIVMSDHGFESGHRRILRMPDYPAAPALEHRQFGIFVAAGPNIKKNTKVFGLGLVDVAPTILQIFNLPIGRDMDGKVAQDIFEDCKQPNFIDSWEDIEGDFGQLKSVKHIDQMSDNETMEQLIELGYVDRPDEKMDIAILKTKCELKHNLARVHFGKKNYSKSKEILLELLQGDYPEYKKPEKPTTRKTRLKPGDPVIDFVPFYLDLFKISLAEREFDLAESYLKELRFRDKIFNTTTIGSEAEILLGKGKPKKAIALLEQLNANNKNSEIWYQKGRAHIMMLQHEKAKESIEKAIEIETDRAKFHEALARIHYQLEDYEEAADSALTAIELVKYYPKAHFVLGQALEKLGDLESAEKAYEMASRLKPKTYHKAEMASENIKQKMQQPNGAAQLSPLTKDEIIIVSGLPRSGTSLMMQMLDKGGLTVLTDNKREADISNPKGYYEYDPVMSIQKDNSWLPKAQGKVVKVVAPLLRFLDSKYRYRIVFMIRDLEEVVKSQQKMIGKDTETLPLKLFETYKKQLKAIRQWENNEPGVKMTYVNYGGVLEDVNSCVSQLETFLGTNLNKDAMKDCVDPKLYRNRLSSVK